MEEAGPSPVFGLGDEATGYWVSMDVCELLDPFFFGEHVEIVIARRPKGVLSPAESDRELDCLYDPCEGNIWWFTAQKVNVLRHDNVADHVEAVPLTHSFECISEERSGLSGSQVWSSLITTESDEVKIACFLESDQAPSHCERLNPMSQKRDMGTRIFI